MFPVRGFTTFGDGISYSCFNIDKQSLTTGDGALAIAAIPGDDIRGSGLRCTATEGANSAHVFQRLVRISHGQNFGTAINSMGDGSYDSAVVHLRVRMLIDALPANGQLTLLRLGGTANTSEIRINAAGQLSVYSGSTQLGISAEAIAANQFFEVGISRDCAVDTLSARIKRQGESSYTVFFDDSTAAVGGTANVGDIQFGLIEFQGSSAASINAYIDDFAISDISFADCSNHWYISGSGIRDASESAAKAVLVYPDGLIRNGTKARVEYSLQSNFVPSLTTNWQLLSEASHHALPVDLDGLAAGEKYWYRFQVADASDNVLWSSEMYNFHTGPRDAIQSIDFTSQSCIKDVATGHPYSDLAFVADVAESGYWLGTINTGDFGYADQGHDDAANHSTNNTGTPPQTSYNFGLHDPDVEASWLVEHFERTFRQTCADHELERLLHAGMLKALPDDHTTANDLDVRASGSSALANGYGNIRAAYPANTTIGELWQRGLAVHDAWFSHFINPGGAGVRYHSISFGKTRIVVVDSRTERNPATPRVFSPTQMTWLQGQIDAFEASDEVFLHIFGQASWSALTAKNGEGVEPINSVEWRTQISQYIYDNVSTNKRILFHSGDDHIVWNHHNRTWLNGSHAAAVSPMVGEIKSCGVSCIFQPDVTSDYASQSQYFEWFLDPATDDLNSFADYISSSGVLFKQTGTALTARGWVDGDQVLSQAISTFAAALPGGSMFPLNAASIDDAHKITITIPQSKVVGGPHANFTVLLTRDCFIRSDAGDANRDRLFDPSSGYRLESGYGKIRVTLAGSSTELPVDLAELTLDSTSGAQDGIFLMYVGIPSLDASGGDVLLDLYWGLQSQTPVSAYGPNSSAVYRNGSLVNANLDTAHNLSNPGENTAIVDKATAGRQMSAFSFFGGSDILEAAQPFTEISGTSARTELWWAAIAVDNAGVMSSFGQRVNDGNDQRWTFGPSSLGRMRTSTQGGNYETSPFIDLGFGDWFLLGRTFSGSTNRHFAYRNGNKQVVSVQANSLGNPNTATVQPLSLGAVRNNSNNIVSPFEGRIEEYRLYSTVLSENWIDTYYNAAFDPASFAIAGVPVFQEGETGIVPPPFSFLGSGYSGVTALGRGGF